MNLAETSSISTEEHLVSIREGNKDFASTNPTPVKFGLRARVYNAWLVIPSPWRVFLSMCGLFALLLVVILPWMNAFKQGSDSTKSVGTFPADLNVDAYDGTVATVSMQGINVPNPSVNIVISFMPRGNLSMAKVTGQDSWPNHYYIPPINDTWKVYALALWVAPVWAQTVKMDELVPDYKALGASALSLVEQVPFTSYPFDVYTLSIRIACYYIVNPPEWNSSSVTENEAMIDKLAEIAENTAQFKDPAVGNGVQMAPNQDNSPAPLAVILQDGNPGFTSSATIQQIPVSKFSEKKDYTVIEVNFLIQRNQTSQFYAVIVMMIMWALSLAMFIFGVDATLLRPRQIDADSVGAAIGLLFALPAIRQALPGSPSIGSLTDVMSFFLNIILAAIAAILLIMKIVWQYQLPSTDTASRVTMAGRHENSKAV